MQPRKNQKDQPILLPDQWTGEVKELLNQNYSEQCDSTGKTFEVFGETYPDEVLMAVSFLDKKDQLIIPITYMVSADLEQKQNPEKLLKSLVDTVGLFFDGYFSGSKDQEEESVYLSNWEEAELNKVRFWYKVTRENIGLSRMADDLLGNN